MSYTDSCDYPVIENAWLTLVYFERFYTNVVFE